MSPSHQINRGRLGYLIAVWGFSLLVIIIGVEIGLRFLGRHQTRLIEQKAKPRARATEFILCVGDSHTAGTGAPEGKDYPSRLESLLNKNGCGRVYQVINLGRGGNNSSQAANDALRFLADDPRRPLAVIFCAGTNNANNFNDARILPEDIRKMGFKATIDYFFANSRAFRLGQITQSRLRQLIDIKDGPLLDAERNRELLDVASKEERELMSRWIIADLEVLRKEAEAGGVKVLLLNYYFPIAWVDRAYSDLVRRGGFLEIDVHDFRRSSVSMRGIEFFTARDLHPNRHGYARIAELVHDALLDNGLIPRRCD